MKDVNTQDFPCCKFISPQKEILVNYLIQHRCTQHKKHHVKRFLILISSIKDQASSDVGCFTRTFLFLFTDFALRLHSSRVSYVRYRSGVNQAQLQENVNVCKAQ